MGPATRDKLLGHFKSLKRIKKASKENLAKVLGKLNGDKVYNGLHTKGDI